LGEETGCPIIQSSLGYIECRVRGSLEEGDHSIFLGEVVSAALHREGEPLLLQDTPWQYGG
jgi:flavin reductase (DIM6/NTAB) family NADH-FMN oxidoreductase RutF